jgi:hypothetical protein
MSISYNTVSQGDVWKIGHGHAFDKHKGEFPGIKTPDDLSKEVGRIINDPKTEVKNFGNGKTAYWDNGTGTIVIHDPNNVKDKGTVFKPNPENPAAGKKYFDRLK